MLSVPSHSAAPRCRHSAGCGAGLQRAGLGHLVVAVPAPRVARAASALGHRDDLRAGGRRDRRAAAARARPGAAHAGALGSRRCIRHHERRVQLGRGDRRRRPRRPAVLSDAALDRVARARAARRAIHDAGGVACRARPGRRGDRAVAGRRRRRGRAAVAAQPRRRPRPARRLHVRAQQRDAAARGGTTGGRPCARDVHRRRDRGWGAGERSGDAGRGGVAAAGSGGLGRTCSRTRRAVPVRQPRAAVRRGAPAGESDRRRDADRGAVRRGLGRCLRRRGADLAARDRRRADRLRGGALEPGTGGDASPSRRRNERDPAPEASRPTALPCRVTFDR